MEYNLTFLEVVKALKEKKCTMIQNATGYTYKVRCGILTYLCEEETTLSGIALTPKSFLGKWRLVDPKPTKKEGSY